MEHSKWETNDDSGGIFVLMADSSPVYVAEALGATRKVRAKRAKFIAIACNEHDGLEAIVLRLADYFDDKQSPEGTLDAIWKDAQEYRKDVK